MDGVEPFTQKAVLPGVRSTPTSGRHSNRRSASTISHTNGQIQIPDGLFGAMTIGEMPIPEYLQDRRGTRRSTRPSTWCSTTPARSASTLNGKSFPATEAYTLRLGEVMMVHYYTRA
ncbi:MAG: hypothetical protein R2713_02595 [Ilumatobacteraceae bacterium]